MSPSGPLYATQLTAEHCHSLAPRLAAGDLFECLAMGREPLDALLTGVQVGPATAVVREDTGTPVGAFGYAPANGSIWSLWARLSLHESVQVYRESPEWIAAMVTLAGRPLRNYAACANRNALAWLRQTGCFWIADEPTSIRGQDYLYFETLPLEGTA